MGYTTRCQVCGTITDDDSGIVIKQGDHACSYCGVGYEDGMSEPDGSEEYFEQILAENKQKIEIKQ